LALDNPLLHQGLIRLLYVLPLRPNLFKGVRYLFKMAEFRLDAPVFALLAWRFDTTREFYSAQWDGVWVNGVGYIKPSQELLRDDSRLAYSRKTRDYLRRRSWRALRRLGVATLAMSIWPAHFCSSIRKNTWCQKSRVIQAFSPAMRIFSRGTPFCAYITLTISATGRERYGFGSAMKRMNAASRHFHNSGISALMHC
jgi:hypothetical protein